MRIIPEPIERPFLRNVPPCQHLKINGTQCGSPALRRNRFCFFHKPFQQEQIKLNSDGKRRSRANFVLPILEDANAIQVSLMQIMRLLASGQIDPKTAGLPYALQTAATIAVQRVTPQTNSTAATTSTKQTPTPSINQTQSAAIESPGTLASGKPNNPESPDFDMATVRKRIQNLTVDWLLETAKQTNQTG
jgi:hypothetical protein